VAVLREAKNAGYVPERAWFRTRYVFRTEEGYAGAARIEPDLVARLAALQKTRAVQVLHAGRRRYWWCRDRFYWEEEDLSADDVYALVYERERRRDRQLERARAVVTTESLPRQPRRDVIPREVKLAVFERDGGRCVECGASFEIQYDHVIPVARGGANTVANRQILCAPCNQKKARRSDDRRCSRPHRSCLQR
jgi:5-methylcytosine-specific restriction endonuclease McrA